jgi:phytoene dehydrogenase-like protein
VRVVRHVPDLHTVGAGVRRDADGNPVLASRAVLADVAAPLLYREPVGEDALPPRFVTDLDRFEWDDSTSKVNWALGEPIPWTAEGVHGAGTVHLGADLTGLRTFAADVAIGRVPSIDSCCSGR